MAAHAKQERGLWYCIEYRDGIRAARRSFGRGPLAKAMAEEAAAAVDRERAREQLGLIEPSTSISFTAYAERWLREVVGPHKATGTTRNYAQLIRDHLVPEFGALALSDIRPRHVQAFIAKKLAEQNPKRRGAAGRQKARNTVRNMAAALRAMLNHAVEVDELLPSNPAVKFGKRFFGGTAAGIPVEVFDETEAARILTTAAKYYPDYELYIRTLFYTGLRVGELLGLQWSDVDFRGGFAMVRRKVKVQGGRLLVEEVKTHRVHPVDMPDTLLLRWAELRSIREAEAAVVGQPLSKWCCPSVKNPQTRPLNASWLNSKIWARILHHAGLRRLRLHDIRHTYASLMLKQGKSIEYVQRQMRHEKIDTTIRLYGHFKPGQNREYANDFAARIERLEAEVTR